MNDKNKSFELTKSQRFFHFFRNNALNLIIVAVALFYPLRRLGSIAVTDKTLWEILADIALSVVVGSFISILLHKKGMITGKEAEHYKNTLNAYGAKVEDSAKYIEDVDKFCEWKNEQILVSNQKKILLSAGLSYEKFLNGEYEYTKHLSKRQKKKIKEVYALTSYGLNSVALLSDCSSTITVDKLSQDEEHYTKTETVKTPGSRLLFGIIFGYFALKFSDSTDWREVIWGVLEMLTYLLAGYFKYQKGFDYITITKKNNMVLKMNYLDEFLNLRKTRPEMFGVAKVTKEDPAEEKVLPVEKLSQNII